jgi:hypothetical protein
MILQKDWSDGRKEIYMFLASIWTITFVVISNRFDAKAKPRMSFRACPGNRKPTRASAKTLEG